MITVNFYFQIASIGGAYQQNRKPFLDDDRRPSMCARQYFSQSGMLFANMKTAQKLLCHQFPF